MTNILSLRVIGVLALSFTIVMSALPVSAQTVADRVAGRIVLQVEQNGEAYYIEPTRRAAVYLGRPYDAFQIMRTYGLGISNADLSKIPVSDASGSGDWSLRNRLAGHIVLQVQERGEAWYVNPVDLKRYYLGRPDDAFHLMRELGLGISNQDLVHLSSVVDVEDSAYKAPISSASDEILYGFWGLNGYVSASGLRDVQNRFGTNVFQVSAADPNYAVNTLLPMAESAGMKVTLRMTGGHHKITTNGGFDMAKWKAFIDRWEGSGVQKYIDNGTLVGHMILDDITEFSGHDPTAEELDEMARYSQQVLPGLMTFVRCHADKLPVPKDGRYDYLDAAVNQYHVRFGDVESYAERQRRVSERLGLGMINGLNLADGGDGSSGQKGWKTGMWAMSAQEIREYSEVLLNMPNVLMFLMWEYDGQERWTDGSIGADYFDQRALVQAISEIGQ